MRVLGLLVGRPRHAHRKRPRLSFTPPPTDLRSSVPLARAEQVTDHQSTRAFCPPRVACVRAVAIRIPLALVASSLRHACRYLARRVSFSARLSQVCLKSGCPEITRSQRRVVGRGRRLARSSESHRTPGQVDKPPGRCRRRGPTVFADPPRRRIEQPPKFTIHPIRSPRPNISL